jgi:solute carrier family 25 carnitine/acylcarnitine transporter 20/29
MFLQGVASPLAGQMFFRASLFGAFGESKRWLATNADGSTRALRTADYYKAGAITGFIAAFTGEAAQLATETKYARAAAVALQ